MKPYAYKIKKSLTKFNVCILKLILVAKKCMFFLIIYINWEDFAIVHSGRF